MNTIQDLNKAFKAIPNSPLAKTNYDKLILVCGVTICRLREAHKNACFEVGCSITANMNPLCWKKHNLPDIEELHLHPAQHKAVCHASTTYIRLAHEAPAFTDLLTELHAEFLANSSGDGLGQYFTPPDLCSLMGALATSHYAKRGGLQKRDVYEPTCGAGGTVLGLLREYMAQTAAKYPFVDWKVVASDIDPLCCLMASLQLYANVLLHAQPFSEIKILCENALTDNIKGDCFFYNATSHEHTGLKEVA